ncbi:MAG: M56 family metallopeptidase, partial [Acetatifactor sp.]|nr:M56 family metallopeptidase [Acetatifactor sp.]
MGALLVLQIQISLAVLLVLLLRRCMNRLPKLWSYGLWIVVFLRLLIPVSLESPLGILPGESALEHIWQQVAGEEERDGRASSTGVENTNPISEYQISVNGDDKNISVGTKPQTGEQLELAKVPAGERPVIFEVSRRTGALADGQRRYSWPLMISLAVWLAGLTALLGYNLHAVLRIRRQTRNAERLEGEVYCCSEIEIPL